MFVKVVACSASILFALSIPAEALFGGGGGSKSRGGGSKASSSSSSSKSSSRSRGGISAGASIGGARAGASVSRSGISGGASVGGGGAGASVNASGARVGASAGSLSTSASVSGSGVNASVSGTSSSLSATVGADGIGISATGTTNGAAAALQQQTAISSVGIDALLPWELRPLSPAGCDRANTCEMFTGRSALVDSTTRNTLDSDGNIPTPIVSACQRAVADAAQTFGALKVEAASAGRIKRAENGGVVAPVSVRITYGLAKGATQVRQADVECAIRGNGQVVALR